MTRRLVLASASPRRQELLVNLGLEFTCRPVDLDETPIPGEKPRSYVRRLATAKAEARVSTGDIVLAADTIVTIDGRLMGKPEDAPTARSMLLRLSGKEHRVLTGVALRSDESETEAEICETRVAIATLEEEEIDWYVATGEPLDKAGAYAIQGLGALLVERIEGDYSNVVGLPLFTVYRLFRRAGLDLRDFRKPAADSPGISSRT
jgi:septum formation protein